MVRPGRNMLTALILAAVALPVAYADSTSPGLNFLTLLPPLVLWAVGLMYALDHSRNFGLVYGVVYVTLLALVYYLF